MAFKAPKEMQVLGQSVEQRLFGRVRQALADRMSNVLATKGYEESRDNAEYGDCLLSANNDWEMPLVTLEFKGSTHDRSFTMSDSERRTTVARWFIVEGAKGVWCVHRDVVFAEGADGKPLYLTQNGEGRDKYWVCYPPFESHRSFRTVIDDLQRAFGEVPGTKNV